jgi:hypothetical protein
VLFILNVAGSKNEFYFQLYCPVCERYSLILCKIREQRSEIQLESFVLQKGDSKASWDQDTAHLDYPVYKNPLLN